ncbi:MAG: ComEC/Rec2 family competence protein [Bacteroidia bacterium]
MNFLNRIPFLRILLPFALGIVLWLSGQKDFPKLAVFSGIYAACLLFFLFTVKQTKEIPKMLYGIALQVFLFVAGWLGCGLNNQKNNPQHYVNILSQEPQYFAGYVSEIPAEKAKSIKAEITLQNAKVNGEWKNINGKIIAYFSKTDSARLIETGQTIVFTGALQDIQSPLNPHEFDYKNYLALKNIYYTAYLKENNWAICRSQQHASLFTIAQRIRKTLLDTYRESGLQQSEFSLVAALVLGYDDEIDRPLMNAYSHTGTLHVLSVSGLHVGIIYVLLGFMLGFLNKTRKQIWLKVFLILGFLWFFVLLSGFSAPAVRAALMFSLILVGKTLFENIETANIVFVAAFVSLLHDPFWLADAGFQLSYVAVLGIIYLYPYFYNMFTFSSGLTDKIWQLCSVSIAAQIATLPITLFYFHQFPVLFLLTNLVLIPVSTVVMYGGILVLIFSKVVFVSKALVWITAISVKLMNGCALFFDKLPFCVIDNTHLSVINMLLMYLLIVLVFIAIEYRSTLLLMYSFALTAIMFCVSIFLDLQAKKNNELVIYHSDKSEVLAIFDGNKYTQICDTIDERLTGTLRENKICHDAVYEEIRPLNKASLIMAGSKKILFLRSPDLLSQTLIKAINPDYVWLPARSLRGKKTPSVLCGTKNLVITGNTYSKKALNCLDSACLTNKKGALIVSLQ